MITKGKWETGCNMSQVVVWPDGWNAPLLIADCGTKRAPELVQEQCANAQAISALPDMIEALRIAQRFIDDTVEKGDIKRVTLKIINKALQKAGVKEE